MLKRLRRIVKITEKCWTMENEWVCATHMREMGPSPYLIIQIRRGVTHFERAWLRFWPIDLDSLPNSRAWKKTPQPLWSKKKIQRETKAENNYSEDSSSSRPVSPIPCCAIYCFHYKPQKAPVHHKHLINNGISNTSQDFHQIIPIVTKNPNLREAPHRSGTPAAELMLLPCLRRAGSQ